MLTALLVRWEDPSVKSRAFIPLWMVLLIGAMPQAQTDLPVRTQFQMPETHGGMFAYAIAPDARTVAGATGVAEASSGGKKSVFGGDVLLWDPGTGKIRRMLGKHAKTPHWLSFSRDGKSLASLSREDGEFKLWDPATGKLVQTVNLGPGVNDKAASVAFDGKTLVTVEERSIPSGEQGMSYVFPGTLTARDARTGKPLWKLEDSGVVVLGLAPDGKTLAAFVQKQILEAGKPKIAERFIRLWDSQTGKEIKTIDRGELGYAGQIGFLPDGKTLYAFHRGELFRWDLQEGRSQPSLVLGRREDASTLAFSPDGRMLAMVSFMGETFELRDLQTNKSLAEVSLKFPDGFEHAAFSGDLRLLACTRKNDPALMAVPGMK
jgi:WD40 repeat protein